MISKKLHLPAPGTKKQKSASPTPLLSASNSPLPSFLRKPIKQLGEYAYLFICFLIPALVVLLIYVARGEHPIDDGCVLVLDLNAQYVWFFEALRNFVHGDADLLYSFSRALGGEFLGIYAYYLASPLSFFVCLFPQDRMLEALLGLFMIKAGLCGVTFGYYIHKTQKKLNRVSTIAFSVLYALSAYAIIYQSNTMWIDSLIWLPLITLGIESVVKYGKFKLYTVSLAVALFSNYYIGWMLCIYCLIYFFVYYFANAEKHRNNPFYERFHFLRSLGRMAAYSAIAIGIAAVILLAAFYSLNFGKTTFSDPSWELAVKFDLLEFLYKLLPGSYDTVRPAGLPMVYCGVLTVLLIPSYFLSPKYSMREKIFSAILILIFVASFSINIIDLIWHGFQKPNWLNYRYSFMLCFHLCILACRAFSDFEHLSIKATAVTAGLVAIVCIILQTYTDDNYVKPDDFACIYLSLAFLLIYLIILALLLSSESKQIVNFVLLVVIVGETFLCGLLGTNAFGEDVGFSKYSKYNNFLAAARPITEMVQDNDKSFYRMEKTFFRAPNDNMALKIRGLTGSTSTLNKETIQILNKMGYTSKSHKSKYLGGTPLNDSLLGLKYIITDKNYDAYDVFYDEAHTYVYTDADGKETKYVAYRNPYALSIAYGVDDAVLEFPLGYIESTEPEKEDEDEKEDAGAIADAVSALKNAVNQLLDIEENNLSEYQDEYDSPFERLNAMVTAMLGEEETVQVFVPVDGSFNKNGGNISKYYGSYSDGEVGYKGIPSSVKTPTTYFTAKMPKDAELFFYLPTDYPREIKISLSVNGGSYKSYGTFNGNETSSIVSLGLHEKDESLKLQVKLVKDALYWKGNDAYFYYIDMDVFKDVMKRLATDQLMIEDYTERSFDGSFTASRERQLVMTTLAYDNGWHVSVDGKPVELVKTFGAFLGFYVEGEVGETHTVEMFYMPKTIVIGFIISTLSILLFVGLLILNRKHMLGCRDRRSEIPPEKLDDEDSEKPKAEDTEKKEPDSGAREQTEKDLPTETAAPSNKEDPESEIPPPPLPKKDSQVPKAPSAPQKKHPSKSKKKRKDR